MCYKLLPRKQALKDENKPRKEFVSVSKQGKAWIVKTRNAMTTHKPKHPEVEAQTPSKERERYSVAVPNAARTAGIPTRPVVSRIA